MGVDRVCLRDVSYSYYICLKIMLGVGWVSVLGRDVYVRLYIMYIVHESGLNCLYTQYYAIVLPLWSFIKDDIRWERCGGQVDTGE